MVSVNQIPLSLFDRRYENDLPFYSRHNIGVIGYQPLCGGLLSDRHWQKDHELSEQDNAIPSWSNQPNNSQQEVITKLGQLAQSQQITLSQMAVGWTLAQPAVTSVVLGARTIEHLRSALEAVSWTPSSEVAAEIDQISPGPTKPKQRFER